MSSRGEERRRNPRFDFSDAVDYCTDQSDPDKTSSGLILNISECGVCFYTSSPLSAGQELIIKTSLKAPAVKATIKWVKKYRDDLFKIGAMFVE